MTTPRAKHFATLYDGKATIDDVEACLAEAKACSDDISPIVFGMTVVAYGQPTKTTEVTIKVGREV